MSSVSTFSDFSICLVYSRIRDFLLRIFYHLQESRIFKSKKDQSPLLCRQRFHQLLSQEIVFFAFYIILNKVKFSKAFLLFPLLKTIFCDQLETLKSNLFRTTKAREKLSFFGRKQAVVSVK